MRWLSIFLCLIFSVGARLSVVTEANAGVVYVAPQATAQQYTIAIKASEGRHQLRNNKSDDSTISFCRYGARTPSSGNARNLGFSFYLPSFVIQYHTVRSIATKLSLYQPTLGILASYIRCIIFPKHTFW